jgi:hypothetical protein
MFGVLVIISIDMKSMGKLLILGTAIRPGIALVFGAGVYIETEELPIWHEQGETWRRLKVI